MSQAELAEKLGVSYPRVNELVHGKRGVTPDTALRLERLFVMEAQFWLNLQLAWDLYQVQHSPAVRRIRRIRRLPRSVQATRSSPFVASVGRRRMPQERAIRCQWHSEG